MRQSGDCSMRQSGDCLMHQSGLLNAPVGIAQCIGWGYKEWEEHKVKNRSNTLKLFLRLSIWLTLLYSKFYSSIILCVRLTFRFQPMRGKIIVKTDFT